MNLSPRKRFILHATCIYLVFGSAWIFLSDRLLMDFTDISTITRLSTAKGFAFIILTALLLIFALYSIPDRETTKSQDRDRTSKLLIMVDQLPLWIAYVLAVVVTLAMLLVRMRIAVTFGERPLLILFMLPIILSSVLGGFGPGLIATAIAALGIDYYGIPPLYSLRIAESHDLFQWFMLITSGILSSFLSELLHRARRKAEERRMIQEIAQEALRESEIKYRLIAENTADLISILDMNLHPTYVSPAIMRLRGFTIEEAMAQTLEQVLTPESMHIALATFEKETLLEASGTADPDRTRILELEEYKQDGSTVWMDVSLTFLHNNDSKPIGILTVSRDITERKKSEALLKDESSRWRDLFEKSRDGIVILDQNGKVYEANKRYADMLGYSIDEITQLHVWDWDTQFSKEQIKEMIRSIDDAGAHFETRQRRKDGTIIDVELSNHGTVYKEHKLVFCICRDITDRNNAEKSLIRLNRLYSVLSLINSAIIRIRQPEELFAQACRIAVEAGNLKMAWIGLLNPETLKINPVARYGIDDGYVDNLNLSAADVPEGQGQTGIAVLEGKYSVCPDWHNDPKIHLWKEAGMARGYRSSIAFPLQMENQIIGAMSMYAGETNLFSEDEVQLLKPLADNISYALSFMEQEKQRQQMENALRQNEERYRTILQTAMDGFMIVDLQGHIRDVNASYCRMSGYSKEELLEMQIRNLEVDETPEITIRHMEMVRAHGADRFETRHHRKDGSIIDVEVSVQYCPHEADRVVSFLRDITDHKVQQKALHESEYRFRRISQLTNDIAFSCSDHENGTYSIDWMYGNTEKIIGYTIEEIKARSCWRFLVTEEDDPVFAKNVVGLSPGQSACAELRLRHKNGDIVWVDSYTECEIGKGRFGCRNLFGGLQDITARKKAEAEKALLEDQLRQAQKIESIGTLAGGIAHDLNNILFPITGLSEMLLDEIPPGNPEYANLQQIYRSAMRGSELVKQILSFSRQSNPQKLPIRIQPILKEVMKLSRATIPANIEITSDIKTECGMVFADPTHIHQIIMNLITNAYHAVEESGGAIHIALKEAAFGTDELSENSIKPGKYVCIIVSDTGTGIDQSLIHKIFEPYFTTKELGKGTGLGLSVVHGIVKQHGGEIRISSVIGKGTTFNIYLPIIEDSGGTKAAYVPRTYPTGSENILLVDDEEPIAKMVQMMLVRLGYRVTVRTSSPDALEVFRAGPDKFALVISDRGMPNMTGEQLARELISIKPEIPVIICTGFSDENDEQRARDIGVKGILKKPVATGDLAKMVRKVLDEAKGFTQEKLSEG